MPHVQTVSLPVSRVGAPDAGASQAARWSVDDIAALYELPFPALIHRAQTTHREHFDPTAIQLSSLLSIKTGGCPEDCGYCSQSSHHESGLKAQPLMPLEEVLAVARAAQAAGARRFCMGAAWRSPKPKQVEAVARMVSEVKALGLETCVTLGMLDDAHARQLADAGLDYYNHNLDTSPEFYGKVITTRTYQDRLDTLQHVREAGIKVCCGGIIGMGEDRRVRAGLIAQLANLDPYPESVPINNLMQVAGTPLDGVEKLDPFEFVRTIAVARITMPRAMVRLSAGREHMDDATQALCFLAGANSIFYGEVLLTTGNPRVDADRALLARLGMHAGDGRMHGVKDAVRVVAGDGPIQGGTGDEPRCVKDAPRAVADSGSMDGGTGDDWTTRSLRSVWHPCTQMKHHECIPLLPIARAQGAWLYDADGRRYLDGISSWWVNLFGHAHPAINAALIDQLGTLEHAMLAGCTHRPAVELAERLSALTDGVLGHAFFASDGASAVEIALKMSFHFWRNSGRPAKREFVCVENGYHGETLGALGVTDVALFRDAYGPLLRQAHRVASPDARQALPGESAADVAARALADVAALFESRADSIAAFIVEPLVQCAAGMAMHDPAYLRGLRALCDRHGVHLIADEIAVGFGRTGTFFAHEQAKIRPDFLCLSKGISGGYLPLSVVLSRDEIHEAFYDDDVARGFLHSHSYTGNPLACRAALATLDLFDAQDVLAANRARFDALAAGLRGLTGHPGVANLRRCGSILAFDAVVDDLQAQRSFARRYARHALAAEALLRPIGRTVYLMPPYVLDGDEISLLASAAVEALERTLNDHDLAG